MGAQKEKATGESSGLKIAGWLDAFYLVYTEELQQSNCKNKEHCMNCLQIANGYEKRKWCLRLFVTSCFEYQNSNRKAKQKYFKEINSKCCQTFELAISQMQLVLRSWETVVLLPKSVLSIQYVLEIVSIRLREVAWVVPNTVTTQPLCVVCCTRKEPLNPQGFAESTHLYIPLILMLCWSKPQLEQTHFNQWNLMRELTHPIPTDSVDLV